MSQPNRTIKGLANGARRRGIDHMGEAGFARLCLDFEAALPDKSLMAVLQVMNESKDLKALELGCIWLDGAGYGSRSIEWLGAMLAKANRELE